MKTEKEKSSVTAERSMTLAQLASWVFFFVDF
jgi:hypothetical protein